MSIKWMSHIWDTSPYSHTMLLLHIAMGDAANDEGEFWYRQKSLAKKARVSERYLRDVIKQMKQDGHLETYKRGRRKAYRLLKPELSSGTKGEHSSGQHRNTVPVPIEPSLEPSVQNRRTAAPERGEGQRGDQMPDPRLTGGEPDFDDTPKKPVHSRKRGVPKQGSAQWLEVQWENAMANLGVKGWGRDAARGTFKNLRHRGHTNEEIAEAIERWWVRDKHDLRSKRGQVDPIKLFMSAVNNGLMDQQTKKASNANPYGTANEIMARYK